MKKIVATTLKVLLVLPIAVYAMTCTYLWAAQDRYIFRPSHDIAQWPSDYGLKYEDVYIQTPYGSSTAEAIHAWWIPAEHKEPQKVLLYLHGSAFNIGANVEHARRFNRLGFSVLLVSYRGYGMSDGGAPSEQATYEDAEAAWTYLLVEKGVRPDQIILYGHSLGGAVAIELATRHPEAAGLIVESTFTSIREVAELNPFYRLFPLEWLIAHPYDSISKMERLAIPVLFLHGTDDASIPHTMSHRLYERTPGEKRLAFILGGGHSNNARVDQERYLQEVSSFVSIHMN